MLGLGLADREGFSRSGLDPGRLFFAILPDPATARKLGGLARDLRSRDGLTGAPLADDRLHISLSGLGNSAGLPDAAVAAACASAQRVASESRPFDVVFDWAASFRGGAERRPFVLMGDKRLVALTALHEALEAELGRGTPRPFCPHVTLLYDERLVAGAAVDPIRWTVRGFVLVHSLTGNGRYVVRGRWPLSPAA